MLLIGFPIISEHTKRHDPPPKRDNSSYLPNRTLKSRFEWRFGLVLSSSVPPPTCFSSPGIYSSITVYRLWCYRTGIPDDAAQSRVSTVLDVTRTWLLAFKLNGMRTTVRVRTDDRTLVSLGFRCDAHFSLALVKSSPKPPCTSRCSRHVY